jgi:hypothetical protein
MKKTPTLKKNTQTETYKANRALMNAIKLASGCERCGFNEFAPALSFDHLDPSTKYRTKTGRVVNPSCLAGYPQSVVLAEIAKCRILCQNCHRIYTHTEQNVVA